MKFFRLFMGIVLVLCLVANVVFEYLFLSKKNDVSDSVVILSFVVVIVCLISITVTIIFLGGAETNFRLKKIENLSKVFEQLKVAHNGKAKIEADAYKSYTNAMVDI